MPVNWHERAEPVNELYDCTAVFHLPVTPYTTHCTQ